MFKTQSANYKYCPVCDQRMYEVCKSCGISTYEKYTASELHDIRRGMEVEEAFERFLKAADHSPEKAHALVFGRLGRRD